MSVDLIFEIKNKLGSQADVPKIDPNTQQSKENESSATVDGAIPAVLAGLYKNTRNEEDSTAVLNSSSNNILDTLFDTEKNNVINKVANSFGGNYEMAANHMIRVAETTKRIAAENVKDLNANSFAAFITDQRSNILKHLPPEMHIGEIINDPAMDDKTNKMEGPMSNLMHGIEKIFSSTK